MPDPIKGWTRDEIITKVLASIGRSNNGSLRLRLQEDINMAQIAFWKKNDWRWGYKNGIQDNMFFTLNAGQTVYTLNTATIGYEMRNTDIDRLHVVTPSYARVINKVTEREIRAIDPQRASINFPELYCNSGNNQIDLWPIPSTTVAGTIIYIDGKVLPKFMQAGSDYPDCPIEYQESFIQYFLARTLSVERDPQQITELKIADALLKVDKDYDLKEIESNLRMKFPEEEYYPQPGRPWVIQRLWDG